MELAMQLASTDVPLADPKLGDCCVLEFRTQRRKIKEPIREN
jgi:hypothetical protein